MFMPLIQALWFNIHKSIRKNFKSSLKSEGRHYILYDTVIYTTGYHEYLFQNPVNQHLFSQTCNHTSPLEKRSYSS